jgi:hypothetical protein
MAMGHSSAAAAPKARRSAGPAASAVQAVALPPGEPEAVVARHAEAGPLQAAAWVGVEGAVLQQAAAARAGVAAAVRRQVAAERQPEARGVAGALRRGAALDVVQRRAALPSMVPWVFLRDQLRRRPAQRPGPQPAARLARAMACFRNALL